MNYQDYQTRDYFSNTLDEDIKINNVTKEELEDYIGDLETHIPCPDGDWTEHENKIWDDMIRHTIEIFDEVYGK